MTDREHPTPGELLDALLAGYRQEWQQALRDVVDTVLQTAAPTAGATRKLLITIPEVAELCSISEDLAYRLVASGTWPALQEGRRWLIDVDLLRPHLAQLILEQTEARRAKQVRSARRRAAA
jgi:excisionase family DNA binding protein